MWPVFSRGRVKLSWVALGERLGSMGSQRKSVTMLLEGVSKEFHTHLWVVGMLVVELSLLDVGIFGFLHDCRLINQVSKRFFGLVSRINRATLFCFFLS